MKSIVASALDRNRHILNSRALASKFTMILKSDLEMQLAYVMFFVRFVFCALCTHDLMNFLSGL